MDGKLSLTSRPTELKLILSPVHRFLSNGSPRYGHHVADLLLLGLQHHCLLHIPDDDEISHPIRRFRFLRRHLRYRLGVDHSLLPGGFRLDSRGNQGGL